MQLPLSRRLQTCADFVAPGDRVADIGCDHGYLSIFLLKNKIAASVIAADINQMPLQSAVQNAGKFGVTDKISFHLSDGAKNIPRDFNTLICAGMGADTIISILDGAPWLKSDRYRLILQCQSKTPTLRRYLSGHGWRIADEVVLRDGRFLYTVMDVRWQPDLPPLSLGQYYFPPALLAHPGKELSEYFTQVLFRLRRAVTGQGTGADKQMVHALQELENNPNLDWLKEGTDDNR